MLGTLKLYLSDKMGMKKIQIKNNKITGSKTKRIEDLQENINPSNRIKIYLE